MLVKGFGSPPGMDGNLWTNDRDKQWGTHRMNPMAAQFYIPIPSYPGQNGPRFNPFFDGQYAWNTQTNPYLNTLFGITNAYQDRIFNEAQFLG